MAEVNAVNEVKQEEAEWEDALGNGCVMKRTIRAAPDASVKPEFKQEVTVHVTGFVKTRDDEQERADGDGETDIQLTTFMDTRSVTESETGVECAPMKFDIGDQVLDMVVPGLMLAIKLMAVGEIARVRVDQRYAYGTDGFPPMVPAETNVEFEVELISIRDMEAVIDAMEDIDVVQHALRYKTRGNDFYRMKRYDKALICYKEGMRFCQGMQVDTNLPAMKQFSIDTENNSAAVLEKLEKFKEAKDACVRVLGVDRDNTKALVRAGRIAMAQGIWDEAKAALNRALETAPTNGAALKAMRNFVKLNKEYKAKEKIAFGGFLKPVSSPSSAKGKTTTEQLDVQNNVQNDVQNDNEGIRSRGKEQQKNDKPVAQSPSSSDEKSSDKKSSEIKSSDKKGSARSITQWMVLLAPSIVVAVLVLFFFTNLSTAEAKPNISPNNANTSQAGVVATGGWPKGGAMLGKLSSKKAGVSYETMHCDGEDQPGVCCVCKWSMRELASRVTHTVPVKAVTVGHRLDKRHVQSMRSEEQLIYILDRLCQGTPFAIPKSERRIEKAKRIMKSVCNEMVELYYDEILERLMAMEPDLEGSICAKDHKNGKGIVNVCPASAKFGAWENALIVLSDKTLGVDYSKVKCTVKKPVEVSPSTPDKPDTSTALPQTTTEHTSSACCLCRAIAVAADSHLHTMEPKDFDGIDHVKQLLIRDTLQMCETVRLSIPKAEKRIELVRSTLGQACVQWSHQVDRKDLEEAVAARKNLEDALCLKQCGPTNPTSSNWNNVDTHNEL